MMSLRSAEGISLSEMYKVKISKASSWNERLRHLDCQSEGSAGTSSGMNRPPSAARPLRTTSSNDS